MNSNRSESATLLVYGPAYVDDVKHQLAEAGFSWGPLTRSEKGALDLPEGQGLEGARLLFRGMPLKPDVPLQAQGVVDGSELRLLRSRGAIQRGGHELRSHYGHELGAPRG